MKDSRWLLALLVSLSFQSQAQQTNTEIIDTISIKEIVVTQNIMLNDENMVKYYQSFHTSGIDKISERLGGVSLISRGAYAKEPLLNSFSGGQINVTIDGMKMFGACTDKMDPITSYIEPINLKSIQLSHGTNGNKNGSTIGGTFNMELRSPDKSLFSVETGVGYEAVSKGKTGFFLLNYGKKKWAYRISGVYKHFSSYTDGSDNEVPFTQYEKINLLQSLLFTPLEGQEFTLDWLIDDAFDIGYPALPMDVSRAKGRIYSLKYEPKQLLNISGFKTKIYYNTVYHLMDDSKRDSLYFVQDSKTGTTDSVYMKMDMPGWSETYGAFAEGNIHWSTKNWFSFKLESYTNWQKAEMTMYMNNLSRPGEPPMYAETWPEHQRRVSGIFLKNDYLISNKVILGLDLRIDYSSSKILSEQGKRQFSSLGYDVNGTFRKLVKSANLTLAVWPSNEWQAKTGIGFGERLPTLSEQFGFYLFNAHDGYDYIGNPEIDTEKSISVFGNVSYANPSFKFSLDASYSHINDYITGRISPGYEALNLYASGLKEYENIDNSRIFSTHFQLLWSPFQNIEFFNVLKYNWGETSENTPVPLVPPLKNLFSINFEKNNYLILFETVYSAPQNRVNKDFGETKTPDFFLLNLRLGYNFNLRKSAINVNTGIENIFDKTYSEHLDWGNYYRPGRNFYVTISYRY